jgi:hypothetical protein
MKSFVQLDQEMKMSGKGHLKIVIEEIMDYRYIEGAPLALFISSDFPISDANITWVTKDKLDRKVLEPDTLFVVYDANMNLAYTFFS